MMLRALTSQIRLLAASQKATAFSVSATSRSDSAVASSLDASKGYLTLNLNRPKTVNALTQELIEAITDSVQQAKENEDVKGILLTSTHPKVFCSGLDLTEIYGKDKADIANYYIKYQTMWHTLYTNPKPIVAGINGTGPAGGTSIACTCDYRVMQRGPGVMGLLEGHFGIVVLPHLLDSYTNVVGQRQAEWDVQTGTLYSPEKALDIGLIDELAEDNNDLLNKSYKALDSLCSGVLSAQRQVKLLVRAPVIEKFSRGRDKEIEDFSNGCSQAEVQQAIGRALQAMKKKQKSKK